MEEPLNEKMCGGKALIPRALCVTVFLLDIVETALERKDGERVLESIRGIINPLEQFTAIGYSPSVTAGVEGIKSFSELGVSRSMVTLVETVFDSFKRKTFKFIYNLPFNVTVSMTGSLPV